VHTETAIILTALVNFMVTGLIGGLLLYRIQKRIDISFAEKLEQFKASLQKSSVEHQIKFSITYPKTLEILETYRKKLVHYSNVLEKSHSTVNEALSKSEMLSDENCQRMIDEIYGALTEFYIYSQENRLYLPDELVLELRDISYKVESMNSVSVQLLYLPREPTEKYFDEVKRLSKLIHFPIALYYNQPEDEWADILIGHTQEEVEKQIEKLEKLYKSVAEA